MPHVGESFLMQAIQDRISVIVKEEAEAAAERVKHRVESEADSIALRLLEHFEISKREDRIIIEVKKFKGQ
jgi:hypothetical protein